MRRILLVLLLALCCPPDGMARTFKIATLSPEGSFWMRTMRAAAQKIESETEGRVKIKYYPGGVMGDDVAVLRKIRARQLQGAAVTVGALTRFYPDAQIYSMPMVFRSFDEVDYVRAAMDPEIEAHLADAGFVTFGAAGGGFAYAMSKRPATNLAEARKQKLWIPANDPYSNEAMVAFGLSPVPLNIADVLAGLQTDLIDAVVAPPVAVLALQWHTQLHYVLDLPLLYIYGYLAVDKRQFDRLAAQDAAAFSRIMRAAFAEIDARSTADHEAAFKALTGQGLELLAPSATERAEWRQRAKAASERIVEHGVVTRAAYERLTELLAAYRAEHPDTDSQP